MYVILSSTNVNSAKTMAYFQNMFLFSVSIILYKSMNLET